MRRIAVVASLALADVDAASCQVREAAHAQARKQLCDAVDACKENSKTNDGSISGNNGDENGDDKNLIEKTLITKALTIMIKIRS